MPWPPRRPDPLPLETDDVPVVVAGTALWALALLALLPFTGRLADDGRLWWLWTCAAGIAVGLFGIRYCRRRRAGRALGSDAAPDLPPPLT